MPTRSCPASARCWPNPELAALRDRANLALGFAYLQANEPARARPALERVRLDGPYSNKALLGIGWADAALGDYQGALTPWLELRERNLLDAAVQESYLAVPYAFAKLNANAQSAEYYETRGELLRCRERAARPGDRRHPRRATCCSACWSRTRTRATAGSGS